MKMYELNDGYKIPRLGFGVYQSEPGKETYQAVLKALETGYRHIDTARVYRNEGDVGQAMIDSGLHRNDIFLTTKLWNDDQGYDETLRACEASLERLKVDYLDLYLLHFPVSGKRLFSWKALERLKQEKMVKCIGVSNFTVRHLQELLVKANESPVVNQVEFHPFLYQKDLLGFMQSENILLQAYSPLVQGQKMGHPVLKAIASELDATPAQVLIAWGLALGVNPLPKSVTESRIAENFASLDVVLSDHHMDRLSRLNQNLRVCWDPSDVL
jgi:diketogulonate reductase-like aldo/keto reductase